MDKLAGVTASRARCSMTICGYDGDEYDESLSMTKRACFNFYASSAGSRPGPFAEEVLTIYYCAFDRQTPTYVRVALIAARFAYASIRSI